MSFKLKFTKSCQWILKNIQWNRKKSVFRDTRFDIIPKDLLLHLELMQMHEITFVIKNIQFINRSTSFKIRSISVAWSFNNRSFTYTFLDISKFWRLSDTHQELTNITQVLGGKALLFRGFVSCIYHLNLRKCDHEV